MFDSCARYLDAESFLADEQGDGSISMQRNLDCMELGAKMCRVGPGLPLLCGVAIHTLGFAGAEGLMSHLPAAGIPPALTRVRCIRREWPRFPEFLEAERIRELEAFSRGVLAYRHRTPLDTLAYIGDRVRSVGSLRLDWQEQEFAAWLTPKRYAFASLDQYYKAVIAECRKPYRRRRLVPAPSALIFRNFGLTQVTGETEAEWWRPQVDLDLLEAALAVRLYRLENGRFPTRLSEIPKPWLPVVPTDPWGQSIAYRLKHGSPLIYSFGPDGRDDGGRLADALHLAASTRGDLVWGSLTRRRH
jgi:hypothetical protein